MHFSLLTRSGIDRFAAGFVPFPRFQKGPKGGRASNTLGAFWEHSGVGRSRGTPPYDLQCQCQLYNANAHAHAVHGAGMPMCNAGVDVSAGASACRCKHRAVAVAVALALLPLALAFAYLALALAFFTPVPLAQPRSEVGGFMGYRRFRRPRLLESLG